MRGEVVTERTDGQWVVTLRGDHDAGTSETIREELLACSIMARSSSFICPRRRSWTAASWPRFSSIATRDGRPERSSADRTAAPKAGPVPALRAAQSRPILRDLHQPGN